MEAIQVYIRVSGPVKAIYQYPKRDQMILGQKIKFKVKKDIIP